MHVVSGRWASRWIRRRPERGVAALAQLAVLPLAVTLAGAAASVVEPGVVVGAAGLLGSVAVVVLLVTTRSRAVTPVRSVSGASSPLLSRIG